MPVKRSESVSYLLYGIAKSRANYRKALACLLDYISESNENFDTIERSDAALLLGEIYYLLGDKDLALFFATLGLDADKDSLRLKLRYARLVGIKFSDATAAVAVCDSALRALHDESNNISIIQGDDFTREEYIDKFSELARELRSIGNEQSKCNP